MKGYTVKEPLFILGALALLLLLVLPQTAQAQQQACFAVDGQAITADITVNNTSDAFEGTSNSGFVVIGGRGTNNRTIRHHAFAFANSDMDADPGCGGANAMVDYLIYNVQVSGGSGGSYTWSGHGLNSCSGYLGARTGTITLGTCPAPASAEPAPDMMASAPASEAAAQASPEGYALTSAPNPFDAGTLIGFTIPDDVHVRIAVYDMLGREVAVVVDEERAAGAHTVAFDGSSLPAGTYLYRIEAGNYSEAKQMVLAR